MRGRKVVIQGLMNEKILILKVSQFRKEILVSSNLPKNELFVEISALASRRG